MALIGSALYGCMRTSDLAWGLGDIGVGLMAWLNIFAILVLQKPALLGAQGLRGAAGPGTPEPQFDPRALGIVNADLWVKIADRRKREG